MKIKLNNNNVTFSTSQGTPKIRFRESVSSDVGSSFSPAVDTWESFADLSLAVSGASGGSTVDLGGRGFCIDPSVDGTLGVWTNNKEDKCYEFTGAGFTIKNAYFRGAIHIPSSDWTVCSDGTTYYADLPYTRDPVVEDDFRTYLIDDNSSSRPRYAISIANKWKSVLSLDDYRFMSHPDMCQISNSVVGGSRVIKDAANNNRAQRLVLIETDHINYVDGLLSSMTDVTVAQLIAHSGPNVLGYDRVVSYGAWTDTDGVLGTPGATYNNVIELSGDGPTDVSSYYNFTLVNTEIVNPANPASTSISAVGEYIVDNQNLKVYYRPENGLDKVFFPAATSVIKTANISSGFMTFENCTFEGNQPSRSSNKPYLLEIENYADKKQTKVVSCHFKNGYAGTQVMTVDRCLFERILDAQLVIGSGVQLTRSKFLTTEGQENVTLRYADVSEGEVPNTLVQHCFFENKATHGQGLSLYQGSWMNATVRHNIFYDCFRAMAFQRPPLAETPVPTGSEFLFENNLLYWDVSTDTEVTGQAYIAFNAESWDYDENYGVVKFRYNTFAAVFPDDAVPVPITDQPNVRYLSSDLSLLRSADVEITGNIGSGIRTPATAIVGTEQNDGHRHWDNIWYIAPGDTGAGTFACSEYDYGTNGTTYEQSSLFNFATCSPTVSTATTSLTPPGIRWTSKPNLSAGDVSPNTNIDWYLTWAEDTTPATPPDPVDSSTLYVYKLDDKRA